MATLAAVNEQLQANNDNNIDGNVMIVQAVDRLHATMRSFVQMVKLQNMKMLEMMREQQPAQQAAEAAPAAGPKPDSNIAAILAGIATFLIGFFTGLADSIKKILNLLRLEKAVLRVGQVIDTIVDTIRGAFRTLLSTTKEGPLAKLVAGARANFTEIFDFLKNSVFGRIVAGIRDILVFPFEGLFGAAGEANILTRIFNAITRPFTMIIDAIKSAVVVVDNFMPILRTIGTTLGRLFFPFTVIMTIYDTVKEAIAGFEEGGVLGGLAGAVVGLLNSIVGMPLDLLKSAVSWLLGKLGFEQAEAALDSFNFQDIISKVIYGFVGFLKGVVNGIIEGVATLVENLPLVPDAVGDKIRGLKFDTATSEESTVPVDMTAPDQQAVSGNFSFDESEGMAPRAPTVQETPDKNAGVRKYEKIMERQEAKRQMMEAGRQQAMQPTVISAPTIDNSSVSSSSQSMIMPMAQPFDAADPAFN